MKKLIILIVIVLLGLSSSSQIEDKSAHPDTIVIVRVWDDGNVILEQEI